MNISLLLIILKGLLRNIHLFILILVPIFSLFLYIYYSTPMIYSASAVIGPPRQSPTDYFMSSNSNSISSGSIARKILGGSSNNSDDFNEYLQLLTSTKLANVLIQKDHILQILYYEKWDENKHSWKKGNRNYIAIIKEKIGVPTKETPDVDDVVSFLERSLSVEPSTTNKKSKASSLISGSSYQTVTLKYKNHDTAVYLLNLILAEADNIIRGDLHDNVCSRLRYLNKLTADEVLTDKREALISVISGQEQLKMMLEVDPRFAISLIIPPYASLMPVSHGLSYYVALSIGLSFLIWVCLVSFILYKKDIFSSQVRVK